VETCLSIIGVLDEYFPLATVKNLKSDKNPIDLLSIFGANIIGRWPLHEIGRYAAGTIF
jgi:hypothetical protein